MRLAQINGVTSPSTQFPDDPDKLVGLVVSRFLLFAVGAAGLFFFIKLLSAGFTYMTSLGDPAKLQGASKELTNAAIGFFVVLTSFFIIQIIQLVFKLPNLITP